ncbi:hypothetical protein [Nocardia pseudobrasiliensis]|uniref:DUF5709 domain-containing protein n=1 Tax=Nocardia pseudobrasiliensis TaxID=45979 RepID=A0A370I735_9NOCA|nr:hypothetical protein [Nocardia pseudobrasiliensis]RDI66450.1 hypothetical protein DFR76_104196 [Nocardia pseudobrasiliensis]
MTDRAIDAIDAVPEADYVEQTVPAYQDVDEEDAGVPTGGPTLEAAEADVLEQSIAVPLDEEYQDTNAQY